MADFEVDRCTRRCAATDREFQPGEMFYSVLLPDGNGSKRLDFSTEAWSEPPEGSIAWWTSRMPGGAKRANVVSPDAALEYFVSLENDPTKADVRYVLGLFLIRRRIARWEHTELDASGAEVMVLYCPRQELEFRLPVPSLSEDRVQEIQREFSSWLSPGAAA